MANSLASEVDRLSGQYVELCYHCHKCAAGCPVVEAMAYGPDRLLRMVTLDQRDPVLGSRDIWLCAGCYTCAARCPNNSEGQKFANTVTEMVAALQELGPNPLCENWAV